MDCILVEQITQQEIVKSTRHFWFPVSKFFYYFLIFTCDNNVSLQMIVEKVKRKTKELTLRCSRGGLTIKMSVSLARYARVNFALPLLI